MRNILISLFVIGGACGLAACTPEETQNTASASENVMNASDPDVSGTGPARPSGQGGQTGTVERGPSR